MVNPDNTESFPVYCDMTTDGGGWTVFQRRVNDSTDFFRNYASYQQGFGTLRGNLWLGLDKIYKLQSSYDAELHIYMDTFEDEAAFATYSTFSIGSASTDYQLSIGGYHGTAGDSLTSQNGCKFSASDHDVDTFSLNCANKYDGAWWYKACHESNLNGLYLGGAHTSFANGVNWKRFKGYYYSLKTSIMMLRRKGQ